MSESSDILVNEQVESPINIGRQFREAREKLKIGQDEVARNLRFSRKIIDSIENGTFPTMAAPAYVQGYLRNYARYLNIPEAPILASFLKLQKKELDQKLQVLGECDGKKTFCRRKVQWIGYAIICVLSLLILNRVINQHSSNLKSIETEINVHESLPKDEAKADETVTITPTISAPVPEASIKQNSIPEEEKASIPAKAPVPVKASVTAKVSVPVLSSVRKKAEVKKANPVKLMPKKDIPEDYHSEIIYRPVSN